MKEVKKLEVKIFYSGFCTYEVEAKNGYEAILEARKLAINEKEILSNLENWKEADTFTEIENEEIKK